MNILIFTKDKYSKKAIEVYKKIGKVYTLDKSISKDKIHVIVCSLDLKLKNSLLDEFINLKFIVSPTTGTNHLDLIYCKEKNIQIVSLKNEAKFLYNINATPQYTFILTVMMSRSILSSFIDYKNLNLKERSNYRDNEFEKVKVGILGCGRVGTKTSNLLQKVGFKTFGFDPNVDEKHFEKNNITRYIKLEDFLKKIDVLIISINYNTKNINFLNREKLDLLKKGSIIINTSRGEVLDETALLDLLKSKKIKSAALDVTSLENKRNNKLESSIVNYLNNYNNLIITPHIAGNTNQSLKKTQIFIAKKFLKLINSN